MLLNLPVPKDTAPAAPLAPTSTAAGPDMSALGGVKPTASLSVPEVAADGGQYLSETALLDLRTRVLAGKDVTKEELQMAIRSLRQGRFSASGGPATSAPVAGLPALPGLPALA